jgi:hypothetical protein
MVPGRCTRQHGELFLATPSAIARHCHDHYRVFIVEQLHIVLNSTHVHAVVELSSQLPTLLLLKQSLLADMLYIKPGTPLSYHEDCVSCCFVLAAPDYDSATVREWHQHVQHIWDKLQGNVAVASLQFGDTPSRRYLFKR